MRLSKLLEGLPLEAVIGDPHQEVSAIGRDSRQMREDGLFVALLGLGVDGRDFIEKAVVAGARTVVAEELERCRAIVASLEAAGLKPPTLVIVPDGRAALAALAAAFHGEPTRGIKVAGVTGTNGKTTVTYLVEAMIAAAGGSPGVIGTVDYRFAGQTLAAPHTTPEADDLQALAARMRQAGVDHLAMEVSSHALSQQRADCIHFDVAAFTNLSRDHLDFHADFEDYFQAKARLFKELLPKSLKDDKTAVICLDDSWGARLFRETQAPKLAVSFDDPRADVRWIGGAGDVNGVSGRVAIPGGELAIASPLIGEFNIRNLLLAVGIGLGLGLSHAAIARGAAALRRVPGRLERVGRDSGLSIFVDYAHTPAGLEVVLKALRPLCRARLVTVFGCGGDRDRGKRPEMGAAAARLSDLAIVTSDNPRAERPAAIIEDILPGVESVGRERLDPPSGRHPRSNAKIGYMVIEDRRAAIGAAIDLLGSGDICVVAGKGHENYQIFGREKTHFSDVEEVEAALAARNSRP